MTFTTTEYASESVDAYYRTKTRRRFWLMVALALAVIVAIACGSPAPTDVNPDQDRKEVPATGAPAKAAPKKAAGLGDGQHEVGDGIKPGTYVTTVPADSLGCYWARVSEFDGELQSILANGNLLPGAKGRLVVKKSDEGVEFNGGCVWTAAKK